MLLLPPPTDYRLTWYRDWVPHSRDELFSTLARGVCVFWVSPIHLSGVAWMSRFKSKSKVLKRWLRQTSCTVLPLKLASEPRFKYILELPRYYIFYSHFEWTQDSRNHAFKRIGYILYIIYISPSPFWPCRILLPCFVSSFDIETRFLQKNNQWKWSETRYICIAWYWSILAFEYLTHNPPFQNTILVWMCCLLVIIVMYVFLPSPLGRKVTTLCMTHKDRKWFTKHEFWSIQVEE